MSSCWTWHRQQHLVPPAVKPCPHAAPLRQSLQHQQRGSQHSQCHVSRLLVAKKEPCSFKKQHAHSLLGLLWGSMHTFESELVLCWQPPTGSCLHTSCTLVTIIVHRLLHVTVSAQLHQFTCSTSQVWSVQRCAQPSCFRQAHFRWAQQSCCTRVVKGWAALGQLGVAAAPIA